MSYTIHNNNSAITLFIISIDPANYREIYLISVFSKIILNLLYKRRENFCISGNILIDEQGGFRPGRSTIGNAFILHTRIQLALNRKNGHLYCLFIDYSKCFYSINRDLLWYKLIRIGFSKKYIKMLSITKGS